jgi:zinc protease
LSPLFRTSPTPPAGQRSFRTHRHVLDNGLRVLLVENATIPAISLNINVLAGARIEAEELAGTAVMVSRLLDEGTRTRTSLELADAIESVGGAIDCDGSHERVAIFLGVLNKDIDLGLDLVSDILMNPSFAEAAVQKETDRTLAEIRSVVDRPQVLAGWEFNELIYGTHPLHRPSHGYPSTIEKLGPDDLRQFHHEQFIPNNAILSAVGDFDADEMLTKIAAIFGDWKQREVKSPNIPPPTRQQEIRKKFVQVPSKQAHIFFGHLGVERRNPDFYALQVMDTILGGGAGLTSRIPRKLRDEQGLAYTTFARITSSAGTDPGKFLAYIGTSPENIHKALDGFKDEISRIIAEPVDPEELSDAKAYLTGSFVFAFESNSQITRFLTNAEVYGLGFDYLEKYPTYINSVSIEDISRVAAEYLDTEHYTLVIAGPEDPFKDSENHG